MEEVEVVNVWCERRRRTSEYITAIFLMPSGNSAGVEDVIMWMKCVTIVQVLQMERCLQPQENQMVASI